jgi:hypothetical protein
MQCAITIARRYGTGQSICDVNDAIFVPVEGGFHLASRIGWIELRHGSCSVDLAQECGVENLVFFFPL